MVTTVKFVTWNLNGLDASFVDERTEAAVFITVLGATLEAITNGAQPHVAPDVIAFQEVTDRTFNAHIKPHLTAAGYTLYPAEPPQRQCFEVLAVHAPYSMTASSSVPLDHSQFGRMLHQCELEGPSGNVRVLTAHFDSGTQSGPIRLVQLHQVAHLMSPHSVFGGDTNMRKDEWLGVKKRITADTGLTDAWEQKGEPKDTRATWFNGDMKARFDRIWLGSATKVTTLSAIGTTQLPGIGSRPSDHLGLAVTTTFG
jgi:endonuclease/exonuclease/phosphatase family metal-dependent hydrolase